MDKLIIILKLIVVIPRKALQALSLKITSIIHTATYNPTSPSTILIIGGSFTGHRTAYLLANSVPSSHRVLLLEPKSHFHFSWILPRFSVIPGHSHKAFIPYSAFRRSAPAGALSLCHEGVARIDTASVHLTNGEDIPFDYCVVATGADAGPPSRLDAMSKRGAIDLLGGMQERIKAAQDVVVIGGGPAGVEVASDAKSFYPEKNVTLIHSRDRLLSNFGPKLGRATLEALVEMGVKVVLGERVSYGEDEKSALTLKSGEVLAYDLLITCTGQTPSSAMLTDLLPKCLTPSGHIAVGPTLQVVGGNGRLYAAGDVAETGAPRNSRAAMEQAGILARNIAKAIKGQELEVYQTAWWEGGLNLTLGLKLADLGIKKRTVLYLQDGNREALFWARGKDIAFGCKNCWEYLGAKPFMDDYEKEV